MSKEKTKGDEILDYAKQKIGCEYKSGAAGPDKFDCSGLTQWAHKHVGITIPRVAKDQRTGGKSGDGSAGDVVAFGNPATHVGICVGDGNCVHAPGAGKTVKTASIKAINSVYCYRRYW